jgi:release factor glutamine methyltransferase
MMRNNNLQIREALRLAVEKFNDVKISTANLDARLLLAKALACNLEYLISRFDQSLTDGQQQNFLELIARRIKFEPIAYILGDKEFYGRSFAVDKRALIPREDTEIIIDAIINHIKSTPKKMIKILDLGVGSGIIAITLALEIANSDITAIDINSETLKLAIFNAKKHDVVKKITFLQSNWYENLPDEKFDIIVSNPPYISREEEHLMARETLKYEPEEALFAEDDGLSNYRTIITGAKKHLSLDGSIFFELGFSQADRVQDILLQNNFIISDFFNDLRDFRRVIKCQVDKK